MYPCTRLCKILENRRLLETFLKSLQDAFFFAYFPESIYSLGVEIVKDLFYAYFHFLESIYYFFLLVLLLLLAPDPENSRIGTDYK